VKRLKSQAVTNRRSLNLEVIAVLEAATRSVPVVVRAIRIRLEHPVSDDYIERFARQ
jgi:hypothetical protein